MSEQWTPCEGTIKMCIAAILSDRTYLATPESEYEDGYNGGFEDAARVLGRILDKAKDVRRGAIHHD